MISDSIIFKPIPSKYKFWITLEDDKAKVNPYSVYNFRYTVNIPLYEEFTPNINEGYLLYINIRKDMKTATGVNIGIDYNYKLFIIFTGELEDRIDFSQWISLLIPISAMGIFAIFHKVTEERRPTVSYSGEKNIKKKDVEPIYIKAERPQIIQEDEVTAEGDMRQRIDNMLGRRENE